MKENNLNRVIGWSGLLLTSLLSTSALADNIGTSAEELGLSDYRHFVIYPRLDKALKAQKNNDEATAIREFEYIHQQVPDNIPLTLYLAEAYRHFGHDDRARLLLEEVKVDRIEVASARVSDGEMKAVHGICEWAARHGMLDRVEVLGFVDGGTSLRWIRQAGGKVINLLTKGSLKHCLGQLGKTPEEHIADIRAVVRMADEMGIAVNIYLEDWSNGMKDSPDYVFQLMDGLTGTSIRRYMLPDTLGILNPLQVIEYFRKMKKRYPDLHFDFHAHNDYDLAVSNVLAAVLSGAKGLHTTINGLGERAGNAPLASVQAILKDHFNAVTNILGDFQRVTQCIQVTAFHKMVNINSRATQEIDFQRLFFIADPGSQALWIQRLFDCLLNEYTPLLFHAGFTQLLVDCRTFFGINMTITFSGKDQRKDQTFCTLIQRRTLRAKLRFVLMRRANFIFVFIPQHRTRYRSAANQ